MKRKQKSVLWLRLTLSLILLASISATAQETLLLHYSFNEGVGDRVRDVSGNENNAIMHNMDDTSWVDGKEGSFGTCLVLDGIDDYLTTDGFFSEPLDGDFTLSMWFTGTPGRRARLFQFRIGDEQMLNVRIIDDILSIDDHGGVQTEVSGDVIVTDQQWHHFAIVRSGLSLIAYLDGEQHMETSLDEILAMDNVSIGVRDRDGEQDDYLPGKVDEFKLYTIAFDAEDIETIMAPGGSFPQASGANPKDGTLNPDTWANLSWSPGDFALSHDVYFGDNFDDVNSGVESTFLGNQAGTFVVVGFPGMPYPDGLVPGTTYYWRIDEVNDTEPNSPWKGDIWSFSIPPKTAYAPDPPDSAESVSVDVTLGWTVGWGAKLHTVYFGETFDDVSNAAGGLPHGSATYTPGTLKMANTYYWRVDEFDVVETHKGDVWSFTTEGAVAALDPANGAVEVTQTPVLTWAPGFGASHEVYFGADASSLELKGSGNLGSESYEPGQLEWNTTYYWRVDEANNANADSPWTGPLWSFTTANFLVIDDMESYNDIDEGQAGSNRIYLAWLDGYDNPAINGSVVGNANAPFAEQTIVHNGLQSMPMSYDNAVGKSEATLTLTSNRDWTVKGVNTLTIWFRGDSANAAENLYVALNGSAVVNHDNPDAALRTSWTQWDIDLTSFADQGVNLANVTSITLGLGNRANPTAGGAGMMYFDDIRLYPLTP
jgi:hypothetical protein